MFYEIQIPHRLDSTVYVYENRDKWFSCNNEKISEYAQSHEDHPANLWVAANDDDEVPYNDPEFAAEIEQFLMEIAGEAVGHDQSYYCLCENEDEAVKEWQHLKTGQSYGKGGSLLAAGLLLEALQKTVAGREALKKIED